MPRFVTIAAVVLLAAVRFCHVGVLWVEEAYPLAAARAVLAGKALYRGVWYDKPPLAALFYVMTGAQGGILLRLAGALFVAFAAWAAWRAAGQIWPGSRDDEGMDARAWAAILTAFFLTFDFPAAAMALTPDFLTLPLHLLAVGAAAAGLPFLAGLMCGLALGFNTKALLILPVCLLWQWRKAGRLLAGFALPVALLVLWLEALGALDGYWQQVWVWGAAYSRDTPFAQPVLEGLRRTLGWAGFHAAIVAAAGWLLWREREGRYRLLLWMLVSLAGAWMGWRYFPRYFFQLLPAVALPGARGFALAPARWRAVFVALLAIPFIRFMPASAQLAAETFEGRPHASRDLALFEDARRAALLAAPFQRRGDTALVWGYRPELYALTGLEPGTRYLDSQPLDGVLADRHLTDSHATYPELARRNRESLVKAPPPTWIFDGLGLLNPRLSAFDSSVGLAAWRGRYAEIGRTRTVVLYRLIQTQAPAAGVGQEFRRIERSSAAKRGSGRSES